jgi:glycosyltransferase involved in cell wall biosynthesis
LEDRCSPDRVAILAGQREHGLALVHALARIEPMERSLLLVTSTYPPVVGGSEVEGQRICAGLRKRGWNVSVLCWWTPEMPAETTWRDAYGTPVRQLGLGWPPRVTGYVHALGVAWRLWVERNSCQSVYFLMTGLYLATGLPVARLLGKRILMKFSGSNTIRPMTASWLGRLELAMLRRWADVVMVLNQAMEKEAIEAGLPAEKLLWMPNPVDVDSYRPATDGERTQARQELGLAAAAECLLFVGRLAPEKELQVAIDAFAVTAANRPQAVLVLVGDGPMRPELTARVEAHGLAGRVLFPGFANETSVLRWLAAGDVYILLSSLEGLPVSLLEAMACGLPAVVSDISANLQLIDNEQQGLVTPLGDVAATARAMERLLADAETRARYGAAGRQVVTAKYTSAQVLDRYERLLTG